jgi:hypothetical protein
MTSAEIALSEISFVIIYDSFPFVKKNIFFFCGKYTDEVKNMRLLRKILYFLVGGSAYTAVEWLWRGRSHISMFLLGGGCFLMLGKIRRLHLPLFAKMLLGSAGITAGELLTGLAVNRDHHVWDYRMLPLNFKGQICPLFSFLWMPLSLAGMWLYRLLDKRSSFTG